MLGLSLNRSLCPGGRCQWKLLPPHSCAPWDGLVGWEWCLGPPWLSPTMAQPLGNLLLQTQPKTRL